MDALAIAAMKDMKPNNGFIAHGTARYVTSDEILDALLGGEYVIVGEHNLLHLNEDHFLLFLPGRGDSPEAVHCIDSDKKIDFDPDVWPLAQVQTAADSLFGPGGYVGIALTVHPGPSPTGNGISTGA